MLLTRTNCCPVLLSEGIGKMVMLDDTSMKGLLSLSKTFRLLPSTLFEHPYFGALAMLDLNGWAMSSLPESEYIPLRAHVSFRTNHLPAPLPEGFGKLEKLQSLDLQRCLALASLPDSKLLLFPPVPKLCC